MKVNIIPVIQSDDQNFPVRLCDTSSGFIFYKGLWFVPI